MEKLRVTVERDFYESFSSCAKKMRKSPVGEIDVYACISMPQGGDITRDP